MNRPTKRTWFRNSRLWLSATYVAVGVIPAIAPLVVAGIFGSDPWTAYVGSPWITVVLLTPLGVAILALAQVLRGERATVPMYVLALGWILIGGDQLYRVFMEGGVSLDDLYLPVIGLLLGLATVALLVSSWRKNDQLANKPPKLTA